MKKRLLLLFDVLRISFVSLIPYYICYSLLLLMIEIIKFFSISFFIETVNLINITKLVSNLFPILINLSISYHLSIIYKTNINRIILIVLNLLVFLSLEFLLNKGFLYSLESFKFTFLAIIIPLINYYLINLYMIYILKYYKFNKINLSKNITSSFIYIIPFCITYIIVMPLLYFIIINIDLNFGLEIVNENLTSILLFIRMIFAHLFWFFGIHGGNLFDTIIDASFKSNMLISNLSAKEFYDLFIIFGGSGAGLSLAFAILFASKINI